MAPNSRLYLAILVWSFLLIRTSAKSFDWTNHGGDLHNRRYTYGETKISPKTEANLRLKWKFVAGRDTTATPTIYNTIYFPSWNGNIYALNASNRSLIWQQNLQQITGINTTILTQGVNWTVSRTTPTIANDILIVGIYGPDNILGLNIANGELVWSMQLDTHYVAYVTISGTYHKREQLDKTPQCSFKPSWIPARCDGGEN